MTAAKEMESMRTIGKYQNPGGAAVLCVESSLAQGSCFNVSVMNCPLILFPDKLPEPDSMYSACSTNIS